MKVTLLLTAGLMILASCGSIKPDSEKATRITPTVNFGNGDLQLVHGNTFTVYQGTRDRLLGLIPVCVQQPQDKRLLLIELYDVRSRKVEWNILCAQTLKGTWKRVVYLPPASDSLPFRSAEFTNEKSIELVMPDGAMFHFDLTHRPSGFLWRKTEKTASYRALYFID